MYIENMRAKEIDEGMRMDWRRQDARLRHVVQDTNAIFTNGFDRRFFHSLHMEIRVVFIVK